VSTFGAGGEGGGGGGGGSVGATFSVLCNSFVQITLPKIHFSIVFYAYKANVVMSMLQLQTSLQRLNVV